MPARTFTIAILAVLSALALTLGAGCASTPDEPAKSDALPESAYHLDPKLEPWVDPDTGYDTARTWKLDGGEWPIALVMSPSQSPQYLVGERDGLFADALKAHKIQPTFERIDLPPRTFHALQRSKWPFVYMPIAVFTDYSRSNANQGDAGGLQYVALAGSTAGGGYALLTKDPAILSIEDLKGKTVAQVTSNPVQATLLKGAVEQRGMTLGDGPDDVKLTIGRSSDQMNAYTAGKVDAIIMLHVNKHALMKTGSRQIADFSDVTYRPNYTILAVERSVLEERPEVVKSFLEAHYAADRKARTEWKAGLLPLMLKSWNDYYATQGPELKKARTQPDVATYDKMLGNMWIEDRIDPRFLADAWASSSARGIWGWPGTVDTKRMSDLGVYDAILRSNGQMEQAPTK